MKNFTLFLGMICFMLFIFLIIGSIQSYRDYHEYESNKPSKIAEYVGLNNPQTVYAVSIEDHHFAQFVKIDTDLIDQPRSSKSLLNWFNKMNELEQAIVLNFTRNHRRSPMPLLLVKENSDYWSYGDFAVKLF